MDNETIYLLREFRGTYEDKINEELFDLYDVDEIIEIKDQKNNNLKLNKNNSFKQGDDLYLTIDDIRNIAEK